MKQKFLVCLTMVLLLALTLCGAVLAEDVVVPEVNVVLSQNRFSGPAPVDVTVTVSNTSDKDMPGPCALYDPDGVRILDFGTPTLSAGASHTWSGTWTVTDAQLAAGRLGFVLAYTLPDESGVLDTKTQPIYVAIVNAGAEAKLDVTRTITPTTARNGQKVYVTYEITNSGTADATDVTIKESSAIASSAAKLGTIKPGETVSHTFTVTMGKKTLSSHATVTFKHSGKTDSVEVESASIKYGDVKLTASVSADKKGGPAGDVVKLTLTLKNTGKSDIGNITVTDPVLGTVFSGLSVAGNSTVTHEKELTITGTADHIFTVTGTNASGDVISTATEYVQIIAVDPAKEVTLSVMAEADRNTVYTRPGIVKFTVHVTNTSAVAATNVTVSATGVKIYPYNTSSSGATIAPGETLTFQRDILVEIDGKYRFDASTSGQLGETLTFQSNEVSVRYAPPTSTPTMAPIATPAVPVTEPVPQQDSLPDYFDTAETALDIGFWVLAGLAGLCLLLIVVGVVGRSANNAKAGTAADSIQRAASNDYTASVPNRRRRYMPESEDDDVKQPAAPARPVQEAPAAEVPAEETTPEELEANMQEAMSELYPEAAQPEEETPAPAEAPTEEPVIPADAPAEDVPTYRRRRRAAQDE